MADAKKKESVKTPFILGNASGNKSLVPDGQHFRIILGYGS